MHAIENFSARCRKTFTKLWISFFFFLCFTKLLVSAICSPTNTDLCCGGCYSTSYRKILSNFEIEWVGVLQLQSLISFRSIFLANGLVLFYSEEMGVAPWLIILLLMTLPNYYSISLPLINIFLGVDSSRFQTHFDGDIRELYGNLYSLDHNYSWWHDPIIVICSLYLRWYILLKFNDKLLLRV